MDPRLRADREIRALEDQVTSGSMSQSESDAEVREIERECGEWEQEEDRREAWDNDQGIGR